ncbi:MAG: hypothetical protein HYZ50_05075 [Deltaproteobacteria bacterium]|nr:hypothetical protein [Deltaproteobacteria bacterium]
MDSHATGHPVGGHEESTVELKSVIGFGIILVVVTALSFLLVWFMLDLLQMNQTRKDVPLSVLANPDPIPPAPRLQVSSGQDLKMTRRTEEVVLKSYRWVNKEAGIVGIPVEHAIAILVEKGLPARSE